MIALIVLNYNDYETTSEFISKIRSYRNIGRIIIVDNHSTDDSYKQLLAFQSDKIDVIQAPSNGGYSTGNNLGIRHAIKTCQPEYIIVSNPDVEFEEAIVDRLYSSAQKLDHVGILSCRMQCLSGVSLESAWKLPDYTDYLIGNFPIMEKLFRYRTAYSDEYLSDDIVEVDAVSGAFFMFSSEAYQAVDGFDEDTFLYGEEILIAERLHAKGYKNYLLTKEQYLHKHSVSINKSFRSLRKRLHMRQQSREIHCVKYLHVKKWKINLLWITFYLGLYERILLSKAKMLVRRYLNK